MVSLEIKSGTAAAKVDRGVVRVEGNVVCLYRQNSIKEAVEMTLVKAYAMAPGETLTMVEEGVYRVEY